ncbi:C6 transcription factor [Metarhizium brunneum]
MAGLLDPPCADRGRPSPAAPSHASHITSPTQHKRRRRVHCKSRLGCLSCKQRKIKCDELRPSCSHCHRSGLQCIYVHSPDLSQPFKALLTGFTMEDFRFYHHVLTTALPSLPFGGHRVWWQVAATAHHHAHLGHALLALGASHLSQHGAGDYTVQALCHRLDAIRLLAGALDAEPKTAVDADALFAATYCLMSQSCLMPRDGMAEYMTFMRGASLVMTTILPEFPDSIFAEFARHAIVASLALAVPEEPEDDETIMSREESVKRLKRFWQNSAEWEH